MLGLFIVSCFSWIEVQKVGHVFGCTFFNSFSKTKHASQILFQCVLIVKLLTDRLSVSSSQATIKYFAFGAAESLLIVHFLHVHFHRLQHSNSWSPCNTEAFLSSSNHIQMLLILSIFRLKVNPIECSLLIAYLSRYFLCTWHLVPSIAHTIKWRSTAGTPPAV